MALVRKAPVLLVAGIITAASCHLATGVDDLFVPPGSQSSAGGSGGTTMSTSSAGLSGGAGGSLSGGAGGSLDCGEGPVKESCDGDSEVDLCTDVDHCGQCGNACVLANAIAVCNAGQCAVDSCVNYFEDINGIASDGCEAAYGSEENPAPHCKALKTANSNLQDGAFWIELGSGAGGGSSSFEVYCDMTSDGGGWTLVAAAIGGDAPTGSWSSNDGVDLMDARSGDKTFRLSDAQITSARSGADLMRSTKSDGKSVYAEPPQTFDSSASSVAVKACEDVALTMNCIPTLYSDDNSGPWVTLYNDGNVWDDDLAAVIVGRTSCAEKFGITDHPCDQSHWEDATVWLKLWLR